jgi:WD40 repeat protein/HEAT repeat protein
LDHLHAAMSKGEVRPPSTKAARRPAASSPGGSATGAANPDAKGRGGDKPDDRAAADAETGPKPEIWEDPKFLAYAGGGMVLVVALVVGILLLVNSGGDDPQPAPKPADKTAKGKTGGPTPPDGSPTPTPPTYVPPEAVEDPAELAVWLPPEVAVLGSHRIAHGDAVNALAYSPDGKRLVTAGWDRVVRIWEVADGRLVRRLVGHTDTVWAVAWSPDGLMIATAGSDKAVRIWQADGGKLLQELPNPAGQPVRCLAFAPDGKTLAVGGDDRSVVFLDATGGPEPRKPVTRLEGSAVCVDYSPDGRWLSVGSRDGHLRVVNLERNEMFPLRRPGVPTATAFSPDGKTVAAVDDSAGVVLYDVETRKVFKEFRGGPAAGHAALVWMPDGEALAVAGMDGRIRVFSITGFTRAVLPGHTRPVLGLAFSRKGGLLASASADRTVRFWKTDTQHEVHGGRPGHAGAVYGVAFTADDTRLVSAGDDGTVRFWDRAGGRPSEAPVRGHTSGVRSLAFSRDGSRFATGGFDLRIHVYQSGRPGSFLTLTGHAREVTSLAFSPDGTRLVSGAGEGDNTVRAWKLADGKDAFPPAEVFTKGVNSVDWSPDGRLLAAGADDAATKILSAADGKVVAEMAGHEGPVRAVAFSPDSRRLATGGDDGTLRLWDAASGAEVWTLEPFRGPVRAVKWAPNGQKLLVASAWGEVVTIDPADGSLLRTFRFPTPVEAVAFDRAGGWAATANGNTSVYLLDLTKPADPLVSLSADEGDGEGGDWLKPARTEGDPTAFKTAAESLAKLGRDMPPAGLVALITRMGDPDPLIREHAAEAAGAAGARAVPALATTLRSDGDPRRRAAVLTALARIGPPAVPAAGLISRALSDAAAPVRAAAASALGRLGPSAVAALLPLLDHKDAAVREAAAKSLGDPKMVAAVIAGLARDKPAAVRRGAAGALAYIGRAADKEASEPLREALADADPALRRSAARALGTVDSGNRATIALLSLMVGSPDEDRTVRIEAARALGEIGLPASESAAALLGAFDPAEKTDEFQLVAAEALTKIGRLEADAGVALAAALADKRWQVRTLLADAVGKLPAEAGTTALAPLQKRLTAETDEAVRKKLEAAVKKLAADNPAPDP